MSFIKEPVGSLTFQKNYSNTFDMLLAKFKEMDLKVKIEDRDKGEIVIYCLTELLNVIIWKCYADEVLFKVRELDEETTNVDVFRLANLSRIKVKKGEVLRDVDKLLFRLRA